MQAAVAEISKGGIALEAENATDLARNVVMIHVRAIDGPI